MEWRGWGYVFAKCKRTFAQYNSKKPLGFDDVFDARKRLGKKEQQQSLEERIEEAASWCL